MLQIPEIWALCECKSQSRRNDDEANLAQDDSSDDDAMVLMVTTNYKLSTSEMWYLDSGCSNHMTSHREWLVDFDDSKKSKVRFTDDRTIPAEGVGNVLIKKKDGNVPSPQMSCMFLT